MSMLVGLGLSLTIGWMVGKLLTERARPQGEDLRPISLDQERPRALSYTEMMNSGRQRMDPTSHGDDWYLP
jgi:hypothetical protein